MVTITGNKGSHGTNGASPTDGGLGEDKSLTQNGAIGLDTYSYVIRGGEGGDGGNGTGADGANGGTGGNATINVNGNIFNNPATTNLTVSLTAQGGDGGLPGTGSVGFNPGMMGNGGNADVTVNGNILQPNKNMNNIVLEAVAIGGYGPLDGNANATLSGNVVQVSKANNVTLRASASVNDPSDSTFNDGDSNFGTKTATLTGNVVQGNITNTTLKSEAKYSNGTATLSGNIVQSSATSGKVILEATGQHIAIEQNKVTVGKNQELDLTINQLDPAYDTVIKGNEFTGSSTANTFVFTDNGFSDVNTPTPSPTPDTIVADLTSETFTFNGDSNVLKSFNNVTVRGSNSATIIGSSTANILTGGDGDDTISAMAGNDTIRGNDGNDLLTGGQGNDTIDGGNGLFDTAVYAGNYADYTKSFIHTGNLAGTITDNVPGRDGTDTLVNVEFLKFADGLYDVTNNTFTPNTGTNHEPVGTNKTVNTNEDTAYTFTVADFGFSDPNDAPPNGFLAVKITTLPANGTLTNNGNPVTAGQFVTVADITGGNLKFTPAANANGTGYSNFTFQVQDNGGTGGGGVDLDQSANTMTIDVTAVNDAPAGTDKTVNSLVNTVYTFTAADFGFTDPNDTPANSFLAVKITTLPANGTLTLSGNPVVAGQFITVANIPNLQFTPALNGNGNNYANFTFQVQDNGGTANGGVDLDQSPNTITFNVGTINHEPVGTNNSIAVLEDGSHTFTAAEFGFSDPNDMPANTFLAVKITTLPANGTLTLSGNPVVAGQSITVANIPNLVFTPAANANGAGYGNFTFQVQDNGGTAGGGVDLDQSPNTMTIDVTSVNDAPAGTNNSIAVLEDGSHTFTAAEFGFTDPNDSPANSLQAVIITTLPANGTLTLSGNPVVAGQSISAANIANLVFTPAANANGTGYGNFTFQVQDNGGTLNGGIDTDQSPNLMTINVTAVNDAPAGTDKTINMNEDGNYVFTVADFGFTDPNDSPANSLQGVKIMTLPANGTLYNGPTQVLLGETISFADINSGLLHFTPAANANGTGYGNFTFQVQDNGGTLNGGVDLDQSPNLMTINVASVNDAPAGTNNSIAVLEDGSHTFTAAEFGFTDPNDSPANSLQAVIITTLPANGTLTLSGNPVVAGQSISAANIANLVFTPAANANGAGYGNFTFQVQDNGGTANGGIDTDQSPNLMTIDVTSVNDAPAGTNNSIAVLEDGSHAFTAAEFGFTDPNDSPANSLQAVIITTLPANGTLTLSGNPVVAGQSISAANIANLVFTPAANANGTGYGNFTFQVQDNGGTLNGGIDTDQSPNLMTINVTSVNDAPAGTDNTLNLAANGSHTFTAAEFGFTDPNDSPANSLQAVIITTLPANGSLTLNGNAVNPGDSISAVDITAGNLVFTPAPNAFGMGYGDFTFQVQDNGGTANGGVDTDQSPNNMTINVGGLLIVGNQPGDFSTIQDAIDAAAPGDTVYIRAGIYSGPGNDNINVNKAGLTVQALSGPGTVTIEGHFSNDNGFGNPDGTQTGLATWLQTRLNPPGYTAGTNGINVSANNVTLKDLTINDFYAAVNVTGALVSGLTVDGVTMQSSMFGFQKPTTTGLDGTTITNSTFNDGYIGAAFLNDNPTGAGLDANDTTITNSNFTNLDTKGIYMETAQGDTLLDGLSMNNVGQYGSVPTWGANGRNGVGININLKYHTYTGDLTISNFHLTDTGLSNGTGTPVGTTNQAGAIVIEGRDDPTSYNTVPTDVSGLNVTVKDGIIDGTTSIGVRTGEFKVNPADNVTGPSILIDNVAFNGVTTVSTIDNHTESLMTVNGTTGNDVLRSAMITGSTGPMVINGLDGADTLQGGFGDDTLNGGIGNDTLYSSGGIDTLDGGADIDTADFSTATNGVKVSLASVAYQNQNDYGLVKVLNVENLTGSAYADVLTGNSADNTILGLGGNDRIVASAGKDTLDGGAGNNTADFSSFGGGVNVNLGVVSFQTFSGTDQVKLSNIQNLTGGAGADTLKGDTNNNILIGGGGDDIIQGFGGTLDIFQGGLGDDLLTGTNAATTDVAYYAGRETEYSIVGSLGGLGVTVTDSVLGRDGTDTLNRIDRVKFLSPAHVSDVDNNGASDLIFQDSATGQITVVNQTAGTSNLLAGSPAANWRAVGTGLFNPDGAGLNARKSGILLQDNVTGDMQILTSISGPSSVAQTLSSPTGAFAGFTALSAGDFNGDAASDILLWNNATKTAEIAFLNVNPGETVGTVSTITTVNGGPTGGSWAPIASGDFNGDGKSDILWQNGIGGAVRVSLMNGASASNTDTVSLNTGPGYKAVATGDFNNDGKSDIAFAVGGTAEIWTMNGDSMTNSNTYLAPTSGANGAGTFTLKGAEDVNGDGFSDLLWQNAANGDVVATQLTTGNAILSTVNLTAPPSNFNLIASTGGG